MLTARAFVAAAIAMAVTPTSQAQAAEPIAVPEAASRPAGGICWSAPIGYHPCPVIVLVGGAFDDRGAIASWSVGSTGGQTGSCDRIRCQGDEPPAG